MKKETKQKLYWGLALSAAAVVGTFIIGMCNHKPTTMKVISCRPVNDMAGLLKKPCNINCQIKSLRKSVL